MTRPTLLRDTNWTRSDTICTASAGVAGLVAVVASAVNPGALTYNPYPVLTWPQVDVVLMSVLLLLLAPAIVEVAAAP
jgi:hypothetical protein